MPDSLWRLSRPGYLASKKCNWWCCVADYPFHHPSCKNYKPVRVKCAMAGFVCEDDNCSHFHEHIQEPECEQGTCGVCHSAKCVES